MSARVLGIGGGIGASRLWTALARALPTADLTLVVNVADDLWIHGLRVCPDVDTVLYALSGRQDTDRGWGVKDETFVCMDALRALGVDVWFNLGDRDLATHLLRTRLLSQGATLQETTDVLAAALGVSARVLPASNDPIRTAVVVDGGETIDYQEFLVKRGASATVEEVVWCGLDEARPAAGLLDAIGAAEVIVIGPSNPLASVYPVIEIPGVREAIRRSAARVVAITPVVSAVPIVDEGERRRAASRAALLESIGLPHTASGVFELYSSLVDTFVVDEADVDEVSRMRPPDGVSIVVAPTLIHRPDGDPQQLLGLLIDAMGART